MLFRNIIGIFCAVAGVVFLAINSGILARGAAKWGFDTWEKLSYGAVAATVPWVIAIMPFLIAFSWKPGRRFGRPSFASLVGCAIWLAFVSYNIVGAAGSVAAVRDEVTTTRAFAAGNQQAELGLRKRLTDELDGLAKHRPAAAVTPILAAEKAKQAWDKTEKCTDIRSSKDTKFCAQITALESEIAVAKRAAEIKAQLASVVAHISGQAPASEKVDPQARIIASFTGWEERWISERLPIATPVILELGSMTLLYFSFVLLGLSHHGALQLPVLRRSTRPSTGSPASLTRQRELCEWFFRECTRPAADGALPEGKWYEHYQEVCKQSGDVALPPASFRRLAEQFIPAIREVDGVVYYQQVLPFIPRRVA
jgi:hypothetical protein